jgi:hypothetical protein
MSFSTALYNIVEAYSNWLYRDFGEPDPSMKPRTAKNFFIRIYLIAIYYPLICPVMFVSDLEEKYRIKRCMRTHQRIYCDPRTTRDDYLRLWLKLYEPEVAAKIADDSFKSQQYVLNLRNSR